MVGGGYYPDTKITDQEGDYLRIFGDGGILIHQTPENYQLYFHTIFDAPGVVAANNFMSIFNPLGSGKNLFFFQADIDTYSTGGTTTAVSLTASRISAASGGSLIAASNVGRFLTTWSNPVAEVRVSNPTVTTTGLPLVAWPPPVSVGVSTGAASHTSSVVNAGFVCLPGQGIAFSTSAGDVDQVWGINSVWAEAP